MHRCRSLCKFDLKRLKAAPTPEPKGTGLRLGTYLGLLFWGFHMGHTIESYRRQTTAINHIPSATEGTKDYATVYMDLYFCLRRRTPEAFILSRLYDRTMDYYSILEYKGPKDPKNPTHTDLRKLSIRETVSTDRDECWRFGWVQFSDAYWTKHLPLTEGQISRAILSLRDMGIVETTNSRGTSKAPKGIRLVRIIPEIYNRAVHECVETKTAEKDTWGRGRMEYQKQKTDILRYDFWTYIHSGRRVQIPADAPLPKDLDDLPEHVPDPKAPGSKKKAAAMGTTKQGYGDSMGTTKQGYGDSMGTTKQGYGDSMGTTKQGYGENTENGENRTPEAQTWELQNRVFETTKQGVGGPYGRVFTDPMVESLRTTKQGDKEHSVTIVRNRKEEQDGGYASPASRTYGQLSETSFLPEEREGANPKSSATKEIEEAPATAPNDSRKEEVGAAPSRRITVQDAAAGLKELCEVEEGPWAVPSDYALQSVVSRVLRLGWTYAVRHMVFNRDLRGFDTPLDTWPILGEESNPSPAQIHALVQAAIDANNGEDPWPAVNGHQDTHGFPKFSDTRFNRAYHRRLEELENAV